MLVFGEEGDKVHADSERRLHSCPLRTFFLGGGAVPLAPLVSAQMFMLKPVV